MNITGRISTAALYVDRPPAVPYPCILVLNLLIVDCWTSAFISRFRVIGFLNKFCCASSTKFTHFNTEFIVFLMAGCAEYVCVLQSEYKIWHKKFISWKHSWVAAVGLDHQSSLHKWLHLNETCWASCWHVVHCCYWDFILKNPSCLMIFFKWVSIATF
jgi:hypothetical protein